MKERLTSLMADKKGQYMIAGVIVILGFLVFHLVGRQAPEKEQGIDLTLDKETSVPLANIDSTQIKKSRLELQQEAIKTEAQGPTNVATSFDFSNWKQVNENQDLVKKEQSKSTDIAPILEVPNRNIQSNPLYYQQDNELERQQELEKIKAEEKKKLLLALLELKKQSSKEKEKKSKDDFVEVEKPTEAEKNGVINSISSVENPEGGSGFHGLVSLEKEKIINNGFNKEFANIRAVIHSQTTISNGGRIELRLMEPISIKGKIVPKGSLLYGLASFSIERVKISISSLLVDGLIVPVKMAVYDMDGMEGIFVPNIMSVEAFKQGSNQAVQGINVPITGVGTAVGLSALSATTQGVKGYASKKIIQQKATLKSNYFIFLKNTKQ